MHPLGTFEKVQPKWQLLYLFFWACTDVLSSSWNDTGADYIKG